MRWTLNRPRLVLASGVMTRSYGRGDPPARPEPGPGAPGARFVESGSCANAGIANAASSAMDRVFRMKRVTSVEVVMKRAAAKMNTAHGADKEPRERGDDFCERSNPALEAVGGAGPAELVRLTLRRAPGPRRCAAAN